jgi:hypothetical protein
MLEVAEIPVTGTPIPIVELPILNVDDIPVAIIEKEIPATSSPIDEDKEIPVTETSAFAVVVTEP